MDADIWTRQKFPTRGVSNLFDKLKFWLVCPRPDNKAAFWGILETEKEACLRCALLGRWKTGLTELVAGND
jgi:hypothetical protein